MALVSIPSTVHMVSFLPKIFQYLHPFSIPHRGSVRSTQGLGPTMTAWGQSIGISIGMLPHTLIMSITVKKTSKYYTLEFDLKEGL